MVGGRLGLRLILDADGSRNVFAVENWGKKKTKKNLSPAAGGEMSHSVQCRCGRLLRGDADSTCSEATASRDYSFIDSQ